MKLILQQASVRRINDCMVIESLVQFRLWFIVMQITGVTGETSAHILCECEALASLRHAYLRSFFLEPEDIKSLSLGAIWNFSKVTGLP